MLHTINKFHVNELDFDHANKKMFSNSTSRVGRPFLGSIGFGLSKLQICRGLSTASWLDQLDAARVSFCPPTALESLAMFADVYEENRQRKSIRAEMINNASFIRLVSQCMKELDSFNAVDLCELIHLLSVRIGWRDASLLRSVEPIILNRLPGMSSTNLVDCVESYGLLKCGSRSLWEALVSAVVSVDLSSKDLMRVVQVIDRNSSTFFKPNYVLRELFPAVTATVSSSAHMSNGEIKSCILVYSEWENGSKNISDLRELVNSLLARIDFDKPDIVLFASIAQSLTARRLSSPSILDFFLNLEKYLLSFDASHSRVPLGDTFADLIASLYKAGQEPGPGFTPQASTFDCLFGAVETLYSKKLSLPKYPVLVGVYTKLFGLVHSWKPNPMNFGPRQSPSDFLAQMDPLLIRRMPYFSLRQIARLMDSYASVRGGSKELWASFITVTEQLLADEAECSTISPEELTGILFAVSEMSLSVSDEFKNSLLLASFERINLLPSDMGVLLMFAATVLGRVEAASVVSRIGELLDVETMEESKNPSVVLTNLALRTLVGSANDLVACTNMDTLLFLQSAQSVFHRDVMEDIQRIVASALNAETQVGDEVDTALLVDITAPSERVAVLVSGPLMTTPDGRPTGTAMLRHRATKRALVTEGDEGEKWSVVNVSACEWLRCSSDVEKIKLIIDACEAGKNEEADEEVDIESNVSTEMDESYSDDVPNSHEEYDLSPYLRKDRHAAHRPRAPPSEALPWTPAILTLKSNRRRKRKGSPTNGRSR